MSRQRHQQRPRRILSASRRTAICTFSSTTCSMISAEAARREVDIVSIAEGRSVWASDLPKLHEDHELTESQMNFLSHHVL